MGYSQTSRHMPIVPNLTGIVNTAVNAPVNSNWIDVSGTSQFVAIVQYNRSAGTNLQFYVQCAFDPAKTITSLYPVVALSSSTTTYSPRLFTWAWASGAQASMMFPLVMCAQFVRFFQMQATGSPSASDTATAYVLNAQEVI